MVSVPKSLEGYEKPVFSSMCSNFASALLLRFVYTPILDGRTKTLGIANFTVDSIVWLITEDYVNITSYLFYVSVHSNVFEMACNKASRIFR